MRNGKVLAVAGLVLGAAGIVATAFLAKKFRSVKFVADAEDRLVDEVMKVALPIEKKLRKKKRAKKKISTLTKKKKTNASIVLKKMRKGKYYTQVELEQLTNIPYRSIRRYVETLQKEGKIKAEGYGKGKKFGLVR